MDKYIYAYLLTNTIMGVGTILFRKGKEYDEGRQKLREENAFAVLLALIITIPFYLPVRIYSIATKLLNKLKGRR